MHDDEQRSGPGTAMSNLHKEQVLTVHHWTDRLFSFTTTRDPSFRFLNGQFAMIGLTVNGRPLLRAYSMASANYEEVLEFFSIKVPDGPLTSRLQHIRPDDEILVNRKTTGTLIQDSLTPGRTLYLIGTGTGLAPFLSVIKDPDAYDRFESVVLVHGCRKVAELAYRDRILHDLPNDEHIGDLVREKLTYYPTVTRDVFEHQGRVTDLIETDRLQADLGVAPLDPDHDRIMVCGGPHMLADMRRILAAKGFTEGSIAHPANFVYEKAFVDHQAVAG
jgi:ferredoxin/flavodoxin---NADP+ reductase